ncbi:hypothetical protein F4814DRAFT_412093 [Daldinia grandis]|nr:hypothetical protein F4814DRAFT_412093 [Daldinia grandis]
MANQIYDWDHELLKADWLNVDWRQEMHSFQLVPWAEVRNDTLRQVARLHEQYDQTHQPSNTWPIRSPAADELLRRRALEEGNLGTEAQSVADWFPDIEIITDVPPEPPTLPSTAGGTKISDRDGATTPSNQPSIKKIPGIVYKEDPYGFWTVGFELELPVAVYRRGGLMAERPHPLDKRWEAEEIISDTVSLDRIKKITVDRFIEVLNLNTDMVFVHRDEDEGNPVHDLRMENMHRLEHGYPLLADIIMRNSPVRSSDLQEPISNAAKESARQARDILKAGYFNNSEPARNLMLATPEELREAAARAIIHGVPTASERQDAYRHLGNLLDLEGYILKRDKRHVPLAGMRPRYRAFSVYAMDGVDLDCAEDKHYRNLPLKDKSPKDQYGWVTIKISSPVLPFKWPPLDLDGVIRDICRVVRNNFRVHRDAPWIPATTQISISHTSGLTLQDIQKLSSFLATEAVFNDLRRFSRAYRAQRLYDNVCGPIRGVSQLGKLAQTNQNVESFDNSAIVPVHGPLRTEQLNQTAMAHIPVDLIAHTENLAGRIFHTTIWHYTDVDSIVAAVGTGHRSRRTEVMVKCRGTGPTAGGLDPEEEERQGGEEYDHSFYEVDRPRGVFEFRQMGGSLDSAHITAWMIVCGRIAEFVKTSTPAQYRFALEQIIGNGVPVMEAINVPNEARQFLENHIGPSGHLETEFDRDNSTIDWKDPFYPPQPK